jgi:hydroxyacylglutathione hydrolase
MRKGGTQMIFKQYFLGCLSQLSYLIGDEASGRAVVIDPHRDVSVYVEDAEEHGLRIERVIETHCHADFVSGHLELAATGAQISYGQGAQTDYPIEALSDGQTLDLGDVRLAIRATPGHTPESISVVVYENANDAVPYGILTGDALFIGDVGRPDLLSSAGVSSADLARQLYHSLWDKILDLPDETRVFPAHGAGSSCGKNLSTKTVSTIGEQRRTNYALALRSETEFVDAVTEGQPPAPPYFSFDARRNRELRPLLDEKTAPPPLSFDEFEALRLDGVVALDTREPADFASGHLRGSLNVGLGGRFAEFTGDVLRFDQRIALLCPPDRELEAKVPDRLRQSRRIPHRTRAGFPRPPGQGGGQLPADGWRAARSTPGRTRFGAGRRAQTGGAGAGCHTRCGPYSAHAVGAAPRRVGPGPPDGGVLRQRVPVDGRRERARVSRVPRRLRSARRLYGLGGRDGRRLRMSWVPCLCSSSATNTTRLTVRPPIRTAAPTCSTT